MIWHLPNGLTWCTLTWRPGRVPASATRWFGCPPPWRPPRAARGTRHAALAQHTLAEQPERQAWHLGEGDPGTGRACGRAPEHAACLTLQRGDAVGSVRTLMRSAALTPAQPSAVVGWLKPPTSVPNPTARCTVPKRSSTTSGRPARLCRSPCAAPPPQKLSCFSTAHRDLDTARPELVCAIEDTCTSTTRGTRHSSTPSIFFC